MPGDPPDEAGGPDAIDVDTPDSSGGADGSSD